MGTKEFSQASYLTQVRRLRELAKEALRYYDFNCTRLKFVNHGENTTFKIYTSQGNYLLRIHRSNYHSLNAIKEELSWLRKLSKSTVNVQRPIKSLNGKYVLKLESSGVGVRFIDVLTWEEGAIKSSKSLSDFRSVGRLIGNLQKMSMPSKHRHYWCSQGLVGENATFGNLDMIRDEDPKTFKALNSIRTEVYDELRIYEQKSSHKLSLIHADLHFGNMIWSRSGITPIDFDDCGYGLQMYDLAVTIYSSSNFFKRVGKKDAKRYKHELLSGYSEVCLLEESDIEVLPTLVRARDILMIPWLFARRDNPVIRDHLRDNLAIKLKRIKNFKNYSL